MPVSYTHLVPENTTFKKIGSYIKVTFPSDDGYMSIGTKPVSYTHLDLHEDCPNTNYFDNFNWIWDEKYGEACYII